MIFGFFHGFWTFIPLDGCTSKVDQLLNCYWSKSAQDKKVVCDNGASHTLDETMPPRPSTPEQAERALQNGDVGFYAGSKVPEPFINQRTFYHFRDRYPFPFRKDDILYPHFFAGQEVFLGRKPAITGHLPRGHPYMFF